MNFQDYLSIGKLGESQISNWLRFTRGMHVFPAYEKQIGEYKGPTLFCSEGDTLILPDLLGITTGKLFWFEAKNKSAFTLYRKTERWQTGIEVRLYEQYQEVQRRTNIPVWLMFLQQGGKAKDSPSVSPSGLYARSLEYLMAHEDHRGEFNDGTYMVFWNEIDLLRLASLDEVAQAQATSIAMHYEAITPISR